MRLGAGRQQAKPELSGNAAGLRKTSSAGTGAPTATATALLAQTRAKRQEYLDLHLHDTAIIWADKAVCLSKGAAEDVYHLANAYFVAGQHHRTIHVLQRAKLLPGSLPARYLAALAHIALQEWDDALAMVGEDDTRNAAGKETYGPKNCAVAMSVLRARIFEAKNSSEKAVECYRQALKKDVFCAEAFTRLTEKRLLSAKEESDLLAGLPHEQAGDLGPIIQNLYKRMARQARQLEGAVDGPPPPHVGSLAASADVLTSDAARRCALLDYQGALNITTKVLDNDPHHTGCLEVHVVCLTELRQTNALFMWAHRLVERRPNLALAWFAVACYYYLTANQQMARRYFSKAIEIDEGYGLAYVGFGHSFASAGEHDQAMASYTTAARLLKGCAEPLMYCGMEHSHLRNFPLAERSLEAAISLAEADPLPHQELGVVYYKSKEYEKALLSLQRALELCRQLTAKYAATPDSHDLLEAILSNMGHTYRNLGRYRDAVGCYEEALSYQPRRAGTHAALAYSHHMMGNMNAAIRRYHTALALNPEDTFSTQLVNMAIDTAAKEMSVPPLPEDR